MDTTALLALLFGLQQALPSDSAVRVMLAARVHTLPDSGKHREGIVVGLVDPTGRRSGLPHRIRSNSTDRRVLSNVNSSVEDLGFHLLDETFPLRPPPEKHTLAESDSTFFLKVLEGFFSLPSHSNQ